MSRGFIHREGGHQGFCQQKDVDDVTRLLDPEIFDGIVQLCLYDSWCHVKSALLFLLYYGLEPFVACSLVTVVIALG